MDRLQYNNRALVGNWYEDRLDSSSAPIPELERTGKYRVTPLKMMEGPQPPELYETTHQRAFVPLAPLVPPAPPQFLSKSTMHLAASALADRLPPPDSRPHGFGSVRPRHEPDHDRRRMETTSHSTYGGKYADTEERKRDPSGDANASAMQHTKAAGKVWADHARQGIRTGGSTDERLQLGESDPKAHTFVQRTWLGHDSHQDYVLRAGEYAAAQQQNRPGLALAGLGMQDRVDRVNTDHAVKFYKKNDTIRRDVGIWNE